MSSTHLEDFRGTIVPGLSVLTGLSVPITLGNAPLAHDFDLAVPDLQAERTASKEPNSLPAVLLEARAREFGAIR
jgi:hypothetical protein